MIDDDDFDPDEEAKRMEARQKELDAAADLAPREYLIEEFLYDTVQGAFWNTATASLISAKGVDHLFERHQWVTYTDANDKESKPSAVHEEITVDNFKEK